MKLFRLLIACCVSVCMLHACKQKTEPLPASPSEAAEMLKTTNGKVLVLVIDGGGIKGIVPAYFLSLLEDSLSQQTYKIFDVIGGTSTGGIIAVGLTTPFNSDNTPKAAVDILDFYVSDCDSIFKKNRQPFGPKYYAHYGIEPFLQKKYSPTKTLADAARMLPDKKVQQVFTTTYVVNSTGGKIADPKVNVDFGPYLFNWYDAARNNADNYFLWEAARATSSAPIFYPVANVGGGKNGRSSAKEKWAIDGGVMATDPAMWGITEAIRTGLAKSLDDIILISLGCGIDKYNGGLEMTNQAVNHMPFGQKYGFWGSLDWGVEKLRNLNGEKTDRSVLTETALYANQFVPEAQVRSLAKHTQLEYYRVQFSLPRNLTAMDNCANANTLKNFAHDFFTTGDGKDKLDSVLTVIRANRYPNK